MKDDGDCIEPGAHRPNIEGDELSWIMSIAISAKRIADAMDRIAAEMERVEITCVSDMGITLPPEDVYGGTGR